MKIVSIICLNDEQSPEIIDLASKSLLAGASQVYVVLREKNKVYKSLKNLKNVFAWFVKAGNDEEAINSMVNSAISIGQHKIKSCNSLSVFFAGPEYSPEAISAIINGDGNSNVWSIPVIFEDKTQNFTFKATRHDRVVLREELIAISSISNPTGGVTAVCFGMSQKALYQTRVKFESDLDPSEHLTETFIENKVGPITLIANCFVSV